MTTPNMTTLFAERPLGRVHSASDAAVCWEWGAIKALVDSVARRNGAQAPCVFAAVETEPRAIACFGIHRSQRGMSDLDQANRIVVAGSRNAAAASSGRVSQRSKQCPMPFDRIAKRGGAA